MSITRVLTCIMAVIAKQADATGNSATQCIAGTCACCLECFRRCLEFINKNAYIDIAINSTDFLHAGLNAVKFIADHAAVIGLLNGACFIFEVVGVLLPTGVSAWLTYIVATHVDHFADPASSSYVINPLPITIAAGAMSCTVSIVFMVVFDQCADTLLFVYADNLYDDPSSVDMYAPDSLSGLTKGFSRTISFTSTES